MRPTTKQPLKSFAILFFRWRCRTVLLVITALSMAVYEISWSATVVSENEIARERDESSSTKQPEGNRLDVKSLRTYSGVSQSKVAKSPPGRFAYVFVVSGCTEDSCLGYILNTLVAARAFQDYGSVAHVHIKVQMRIDSTNRLPQRMEQWLSAAGVSLDYIPQSATQSFGMATLHKFRVLDMTEYDRVLFLDADILPLCHMDYMFTESMKMDGLLQKHVAIAGAVAPATASMFLVTPHAGEYQKVIDLVRQHRNRPVGSTVFNSTVGWGQPIIPPDKWEAWGSRKGGTKWDFYAASSDQGLLYHWIRYLWMNYTQIHADRIETWQQVDSNNLARWKNTIVFPVSDSRYLARTSVRPLEELHGCGDPNRNGRGGRTKFAPWLDHYHFSGNQKPWNQPILASDAPSDVSSVVVGKGEAWARNIWLYFLVRANLTYSLGLPSRIHCRQGNPLGYKATDQDLLNPRIDLPL